MDWILWTDSSNAILKKKDIRNRIVASAQQWWIKPIDITTELLREKGVFNTEETMQVVRELICEFYGIGMWELAKNDKEFLIKKYWIPEDKFNTLREWDVMIAYNEFAKHHNGDGKQWDNLTSSLPTTTVAVDAPEKNVKQEEQKMYAIAKQNLQKMMEWETDKEKLELYEAQMKVLDLKLKNADAW